MCDLAWVTERAENLVSHHARALRGAGLASRGATARWSCTRLPPRAGRCLTSVPRREAAPEHAAAPGRSRRRRDERLRLAARVKLLSWVSLAYMTLEGGIAILAGVLAGSVALIGFGIDSAIEGFASAIIVWRFTGDGSSLEAAETRAQKLVAIQFFILAPYVGFESVEALVEATAPTSAGWASRSAPRASSSCRTSVSPSSGSPTSSARRRPRARAARTCSAPTSPAPAVGLLGNAAFGAWWLDPVVGLLIAAVAVREGIEAWRGEGCACASGRLRIEDAHDACCSGEELKAQP